MAEVINVVVAFAVIVFLFRWVTSGSDSSSADASRAALGFKPKEVSQEMVDTISNMFPDLPVDNIRYDLLRTGSVEQTTNKILEKGFLDAPPAGYFRLYPRQDTPTGTPAQAQATGTGTKQKETLISRYGLQTRLESPDADDAFVDDDTGGAGVGAAAGKAAWEETKEAREASLRERKAKMILAARQRMLALEKGKGKEKAS